MYIDTHAHLYLEQFEEDIDLLIELILEAEVNHVYLPNVDSSTYESMMELAGEYPEMLHPMIGVHPCSIKENYKDELKFAREKLESEKFVGIGEIGIDLHWDKTFHKEQKEAFETQIEWSREMGLPFVIHSREALDETIETVTRMQDGNLKGIFHCFNGTEEQANKIKDVGFLIGIGGVITYKNAGVKEELINLPLDMMVLETDSPYLSPTPFRGKRNQSNYIPIIAEQLAVTLDEKLEKVKEVTTKNALDLFNTPIFKK
ncbi:TatD family hydrolase [Portibacter lacus]|uniref:TatD family hydrolase n=1 Tax=Portibacter lacus TaxID=1099794 RepID=A0AA37SNR8_9BACT|nr:TatD family hydrolase [Portibacter lacus]GLR16657.1 TatD family hydrolase [Portibacter lacus]